MGVYTGAPVERIGVNWITGGFDESEAEAISIGAIGPDRCRRNYG